MSRRVALGWVLLLVLALDARAQQPFSKDLLPAQGVTFNGEALTPLARVGLERAWYGVIPLSGNEKVLLVSLAEDMLFVQTSESYLHAFDSESGKHLWMARIGVTSARALPVAVNSYGVFATGNNILYCIERNTGKTLWMLKLEAMPSSAAAADETRVSVGLYTGKLATYNLKTLQPAFLWQTGGELISRPILAGAVVAFASMDTKAYVARIDPPVVLFRYRTSGPISAPMATHDTRTLIIGSHDHAVYAVDLFTGDTRWSIPTGAPIDQEPLVAQDDIYVINTRGLLTAINALNGDMTWDISTGGGRLLAVGEKRVYLETAFRDLYIVDRKTGKMVADARSVRERSGLNLREFNLTPINPLSGRIFLGSSRGMIVCLRETGRIKPYLLRDPAAKPFGFVPKEGELIIREGAPPAAGGAPPAEGGAAPAPAPAGATPPGAEAAR